MSTSFFAQACAEYKFLREKGYPEKATLKLVGDRHRLTRVQRNSMFRGIMADAVAGPRLRKIALPAVVRGRNLGIDWYNVLITLESFLRGSPVFISDDGIVRDSSETHGSYRSSELTVRAFREIAGELKLMAPSRIDVYLDAPIAFSGLMAEEVRLMVAEVPCPAEVSVAQSADLPLKSYEGIVASSDSVILDSARQIIDLPRSVLQRSFDFIPPRVSDLHSSSP